MKELILLETRDQLGSGVSANTAWLYHLLLCSEWRCIVVLSTALHPKERRRFTFDRYFSVREK